MIVLFGAWIFFLFHYFSISCACYTKNRNNCHIYLSCSAYLYTPYKFRIAISISQNICVCVFFLFSCSSVYRVELKLMYVVCCIVAVLLNFCDYKILEHKRFYVLHNSRLLHSSFNVIAAVSTDSKSIYLYNACRVPIRCGFLPVSRERHPMREIYFGDFVLGQ